MYTPCCSLLYLVKGGSAGKGLQEAWSHYGGTPGEEPVVSWFLRAASIHSWDRPAGILIPFPHKKNTTAKGIPHQWPKVTSKKAASPSLDCVFCTGLFTEHLSHQKNMVGCVDHEPAWWERNAAAFLWLKRVMAEATQPQCPQGHVDKAERCASAAGFPRAGVGAFGSGVGLLLGLRRSKWA